MRILFITTCFIAQFTGLFAQFLNLKDKTVYKDSTLKALYSGIDFTYKQHYDAQPDKSKYSIVNLTEDFKELIKRVPRTLS
jgi:hypothetical protein